MPLPDFLRVHKVRAPNLMWLLGAGTSASSGVATAAQMTLLLKRDLYCAEQSVPVGVLADLNDPVTLARLDANFLDDPRFSGIRPEDEYAAYFEVAYPNEGDRRRLIEEAVAGRTASYGYRALAALVALGRVRVIWTTNFDPLIEQPIARVPGSEVSLTAAALGEPDVALRAINEGRWPLLGKLHGDFRSTLLKNTRDELRQQDERMRTALTESCRRFGLVVVGYSGRDESVMSALAAALDAPQPFPHGLFWLHLGPDPPLESVTSLLGRSRSVGVDARLVPIETFDEVMARLLHLEDLPDELQRFVSPPAEARRLAELTVPPPSPGTWPVLRLNALRMPSFPTTARLVRCRIGGTREVRQAIEAAGSRVVAVRRGDGVIAFGPDDEVRRTFDPFGVETFDLAPIDPTGLQRGGSTDLGLLYDALPLAVTRERPLRAVGRGRTHLVAVDARSAGDVLGPLIEAAGGAVHGSLDTGERWSEAARLRLEHRFGALWLLLEPAVLVEGEGPDMTEEAKLFRRERVARRYNAQWEAVLLAWSKVIRGGDQEAELRAFGIGDGVDAVFRLAPAASHSRRGGT